MLITVIINDACSNLPTTKRNCNCATAHSCQDKLQQHFQNLAPAKSISAHQAFQSAAVKKWFPEADRVEMPQRKVSLLALLSLAIAGESSSNYVSVWVC